MLRLLDQECFSCLGDHSLQAEYMRRYACLYALAVLYFKSWGELIVKRSQFSFQFKYLIRIDTACFSGVNSIIAFVDDLQYMN